MFYLALVNVFYRNYSLACPSPALFGLLLEPEEKNDNEKLTF